MNKNDNKNTEQCTLHGVRQRFIMENNFVTLASGFTCDGTFRFGKHKGKSFVEVATDLKEPDYFLWLRKNLKGKLDNDLHRFIEDNLDKLKSLPKIEYEPEGDWGDLCF